MKKPRHKRSSINKKRKGVMICLGALIVSYLGGAVFFKNHFYFGSKINGINISGKNIEEAEKQISSVISTYALELEGKEDLREKINGQDIGLKHDLKDEVKKFKESQNSIRWINSLFSKSTSQIDILVTFDENLLKEKLNKLTLFNNKDVIESKDVSFEYVDKGYKMIAEIYGNKIKKDVAYEKVKSAILESKNKLNLEEANCYEKPKYTSKSKEAIEAKKLLDKYTSLTITYTFGDEEESISGTDINKWLGVNKDMNIIFEETKIRHYVDSLAVKYNSFGKTRKFATSTGKMVDVYGGNYGWVINKAEEVKSLIEVIKRGKDETREPIYSQKAASHNENDIGDTYVEINLTTQHMWLYKNGSLITETDIVTGDINKNFATPSGTYRLNYKEKNATLKGENYRTPVEFWMPFNGHIGIHDATWRTEFGKDIYTKNGSHGCINTPYNIAKIIFDNIQAGIPVICYTE